MSRGSMTWESLQGDARDSLVEALEWRKKDGDDLDVLVRRGDIHDTIHEIADGAVPVYNSDIMAVAAHPDVWSADVDDYGQAKDLIQAAQWCIYSALREYLDGEVGDIIDALAEDEDDKEGE